MKRLFLTFLLLAGSHANASLITCQTEGHDVSLMFHARFGDFFMAELPNNITFVYQKGNRVFERVIWSCNERSIEMRPTYQPHEGIFTASRCELYRKNIFGRQILDGILSFSIKQEIQDGEPAPEAAGALTFHSIKSNVDLIQEPVSCTVSE